MADITNPVTGSAQTGIMPRVAVYGATRIYLMRAVRTQPGPTLSTVYWQATEIDDTGAQSGIDPAQLSQISFIRQEIIGG